MAFTTTDLDKIRRAIATGALTVRYEDRTVTYRSMDELLTAEQRIVSALAAGSTTRRPRQSVVVGSRGLS